MFSWPSIVLAVVIVLFGLLQRRTKLKLNGKHIVITGGSSGIGYSLAKQFLLEGCKVTLIARNIDRLQQAKTELTQFAEKHGKKAAIYTHSANVTNKTQVKDAIDSAQKVMDAPVDVLMCNAGAAAMGECQCRHSAGRNNRTSLARHIFLE